MSSSGIVRPAVGPVLPLTSSYPKDGGTLLGADPPSTNQTDPTATKVFTRGDPLTAPTGRADNFSWPRNDSGVSTSAEVPSEGVSPMPAEAPKAGMASSGKKQAASKIGAARKKVLFDRVTGKARHEQQ